ncbi:MAG: hypothetical protein H7Z43_11515 [Clostridia bacterium]|nr:hypothetical protein [Deltaproteobacteria bacterium]
MKLFSAIALAGAIGCASGPKTSLKAGSRKPQLAIDAKSITTRYADGAAKLAAGDTVEAARLFASVPERDPDYAKARSQLGTLSPDVATITQSWLRQVDKSVRAERYQAAHRRLEHMLEHFGLDDATRAQVEARMQAIDQESALALANLETLDQQTPGLVTSGDLTHALIGMRRALTIARDSAPDTTFERERRIAALEQRIGFAPPIPKNGEPVAAKKESRKARRKGEKETPTVAPANASVPTPSIPTSAVVTSSTASTADEPDSEPPSEEMRMRGLLEEANAFRENKAYFNAIVGYDRVRTIDRDNAQAKVALNDLEPKRQELVRTYLDTANQHFQQQDLAGAVPYFRKVLLLEPDNSQAKKGLEMHYNLERIRREKRAAQ